jgi:gliding motility-associated-like protein
MSQNIGSSVSLVISVEGTYIVRITKNGCSEDFSVIVDNSYCGIPNGISPNDDNLNDNFDLSNFKVKNLQIFNRYGMEMYRKANYVNEWAGQTNDGQKLPDGTYYYIIEFQNGTIKVGWVYKNSEY